MIKQEMVGSGILDFITTIKYYNIVTGKCNNQWSMVTIRIGRLNWVKHFATCS